MDCVLKSFAHAINYHHEHLMRFIGHDGTEMFDETLSEPFCRRGFNLFELTRVLLGLGFTTTTFSKYDTRFCAGMREPKFYPENGDRIKPWTYREPMYCLSSFDHMIGVRNDEVLDLTKRCVCPQDFDYQMIHIIRA